MCTDPTSQLPADLYGFPLIAISPYQWCYLFRDSRKYLYCTVKIAAARHGSEILDFSVVVDDQCGHTIYDHGRVHISNLQAAVRSAGREVLQDLRERHAIAKVVQDMLEAIEERLNPEKPTPTLWERLG